jgi:hypothetical protein
MFSNGESPWGEEHFENARLDSTTNVFLFLGHALQWIKPVGGGHYENVRLDSITASSLAPYLNMVPPTLVL